MVRTTLTVDFAEFAWCGQEMYHCFSQIKGLHKGAGEKRPTDRIDLFSLSPAPMARRIVPNSIFDSEKRADGARMWHARKTCPEGLH